jgi:hypothetical protein
MLDQYAIGVPLKDAISDFEIRDNNIGDFFYWQNSDYIQCWMEQLYDYKQGQDILEDGIYMRISAEDLNKLEYDLSVEDNHLLADYNKNIEFVKIAKSVINDLGVAVYYTCSW